VALTLAWVSSASAIAITLSFTDLIPGANVVIGGVPAIPGVPFVVSAPDPELATVSVGNVTTGVSSTVLASVALTEPGQPSVVSDLVSVLLFSNSAGLAVGGQVAFRSDIEGGSPLPPGTISLVETGLLQVALHQEFSILIGGLVPFSLDLTVNTASDLDNGLAPVPEPSTLLLFGSSLAGIGAVWRRYRHS
jgi:hypothetical protein